MDTERILFVRIPFLVSKELDNSSQGDKIDLQKLDEVKPLLTREKRFFFTVVFHIQVLRLCCQTVKTKTIENVK